MGFKCKECGYIGYYICKNCHRTAEVCRCGKWEPNCPKCHESG